MRESHHALYIFLLIGVSLVLPLSGLFGCTSLAEVSKIDSASGAVGKSIDSLNAWLAKVTGPTIKKDTYCDSFEEPTYDLTGNVMQAASTVGLEHLAGWAHRDFKGLPTDNSDIEKIVKAVSQQYVWMPVSFETSLGNALHARSEKEGYILGRKSKRTKRLYAKAEAALQTAVKDYTKLPYSTKLYIVKSDQVNAQALPAGYIYVTQKAASDLDANALQLVLGHEIAHIAKRHTSKQIQQRLVDTGVAAEMFQRIIENRSMDVIDKFYKGEKVIDSFNDHFAKYDQGQELQADACSIRGMLSAGADPLQARAEYLRIRGTSEEKSTPATSQSSKAFGLGFTDHPDDKARDQFFQAAYRHHLQKNRTGCSGFPLGCGSHWRATKPLLHEEMMRQIVPAGV